jgi:hypothetical protein
MLSVDEPTVQERRSPRRIHLVTSAGFPNYGDELITALWLRRLAECAPDAEVWVDTHSPGLSSVLLDGLHPKARFVDTLWRLCWAAPSEQPWEVAAWVDQAVSDVGRAPRWALATEQLRTADLVHIIGGGYLHGEWPRHVGLLSGALAASRVSGARTVLTGQGLAPASVDSAALLAALAGRFDVVDLRDEASEQLLRDGGVGHAKLTCDDAFLGLGQLPIPPNGDLPGFMLCAQADMLSVDRSSLARLVLDTLRAWHVRPDNLGVVEGIPGIDREIWAMLEYQLPGARFYPFAEIWREGLPVAAGQTWLSTRFHPHLMAAAAGASGAAIPVSPGSYSTKHRSLINQGSRWTVADDLVVPELPTAGGFPAEVVRHHHAAKLRVALDVYGPPVVGRAQRLDRHDGVSAIGVGRSRLWDRPRRAR